MRKKLPLIIGLILTIIAGVMIKIYIDQQKEIVVEAAKRRLEAIQSNQAAVLVAKKDIPRDSVLNKDMLDVAIVPNQLVQPQAATSLDRVTGMVTVIPISKGEQITTNKLMSSKEVTGGSSLAMVTPIGKRAVTVSIDNISAVGGMIMPGDYVDVSAVLNVPVQAAQGKTVTQVAMVPLFQNILVLAVGQETAALRTSVDSRYKKEEKKESSPAITLALTPEQANIMAFVQEQGKIRLSLRSPSDAKIESVQPATWDSLFQFMVPKEILEERRRKEEEPAKEDRSEYIEIYRGLKKEKLPISKEK